MIRKIFFYLFFISALAFFYVTCSDVNAAKKVYEGTVVKVTDGDSIKCPLLAESGHKLNH